jgi:UDP-glucose 4-epimerase
MKMGILMGGAGYITSHLAEKLLETADELHVLEITEHLNRLDRRHAAAIWHAAQNRVLGETAALV